MVIIPGIIFLIILAPLAVGSVHIVTYSAAELIIFSLLLIHVVTYSPADGPGLASPAFRFPTSGLGLFSLFFPLLLFLLFVLFQMVPLPVTIVRFLSPNTFGLYENLGLLSGHGTTGAVTSPYIPLSLSIHGTSVAFLKWAAYGALFFIITTYRPTGPALEGTRWIAILVLSVILIGFVEALYGLFAYVNDPDALLWFTRTHRSYSNRVAGTYVNPNHLAGLMNITIPLAVAFFVSFAGSVRRGKGRARNVIIELAASGKAIMSYLLLFSIILMVLALIFSGSRMGQFAFFCGLAATAMLSVFRGARKGQQRVSPRLLLIAIGCLSIAVLWGAWKGLDPVIERWGTAGQELTEARTILWETTKPLIRDFPVTGTGFGTYELAYRSYQPESFGTTLYDHAHNDYLQVLAETGWIGFVLWLAFFALFLVRVIIKWFQNTDPFSVAIGAGGIAATIALLVHSFGEFNLQIPANALLLFVVMAITWRTV